MNIFIGYYRLINFYFFGGYGDRIIDDNNKKFLLKSLSVHSPNIVTACIMTSTFQLYKNFMRWKGTKTYK